MEDVLTGRMPAAIIGQAQPVEKNALRGFSEKLRALDRSLSSVKDALREQDEKLALLRQDAAALKGTLGDLSARTRSLEERLPPPETKAAAAAVPAPVPVVEPRPVFRLPAVEEEERLRTRPDVAYYPDAAPMPWAKLAPSLPYIALAALAVAMFAKAPWRVQKAELVSTDGPARIAASAEAVNPAQKPNDLPSPAAALGPDLAVDEQASDDVLQLVYAYKPGGLRENVREILGPEIESSAEGTPWIIERAEGGKLMATLRPYGDVLEGAPVYEFEVDLKSRSVRPTSETETALRAGAVADSR
jgi:hypothetical protein